MQLHSDPDYTGTIQADPAIHWHLTNEQWWILAKVIYRELLRAWSDPLNENGPDFVAKPMLELARNHTTAILDALKKDYWGVLTQVMPMMPILWIRHACFAARWAKEPENKRQSLLRDIKNGDIGAVNRWIGWLEGGLCPSQTFYDSSYVNGVSIAVSLTNPYATRYVPPATPETAFARPATPEEVLEEYVDEAWKNAGFSDDHVVGGLVRTQEVIQGEGPTINITIGTPTPDGPPPEPATKEEDGIGKWVAIVLASAVAITIGGVVVHYVTKKPDPTSRS